MLHDWCNKDYGMCYPVCGTVHINDLLLQIGKSNPCRYDSGFPLLLSIWSLTTYPTPCIRKSSVSVSLKMLHFSSTYSSGFPLSLSECPFTICMTPYNRK